MSHFTIPSWQGREDVSSASPSAFMEPSPNSSPRQPRTGGTRDRLLRDVRDKLDESKGLEERARLLRVRADSITSNTSAMSPRTTGTTGTSTGAIDFWADDNIDDVYSRTWRQPSYVSFRTDSVSTTGTGMRSEPPLSDDEEDASHWNDRDDRMCSIDENNVWVCPGPMPTTAFLDSEAEALRREAWELEQKAARLEQKAAKLQSLAARLQSGMWQGAATGAGFGAGFAGGLGTAVGGMLGGVIAVPTAAVGFMAGSAVGAVHGPWATLTGDYEEESFPGQDSDEEQQNGMRAVEPMPLDGLGVGTLSLTDEGEQKLKESKGLWQPGTGRIFEHKAQGNMHLHECPLHGLD